MSEAKDATNMVLIRIEAKSLGSPDLTAVHPTHERQVKAATKTRVLKKAAGRAQEKRRSMRIPHRADNPPKAPPESKAVLAPAGLEAKPATPHKARKSPNPTNQRPENFISLLGALSKDSFLGQADHSFHRRKTFESQGGSASSDILRCHWLWPSTTKLFRYRISGRKS